MMLFEFLVSAARKSDRLGDGYLVCLPGTGTVLMLSVPTVDQPAAWPARLCPWQG